MAENPVETGPKISRRTALKGALGAIGAAGFVSKEVQVMHEGIETPVGIFFPLYERHDRGIEVGNLPQGLDGFFREGPIGAEFQPNQLLDKLEIGDVGIPWIKGEVLEVLARNNTKVVLGDVALGAELFHQSLTAPRAILAAGAGVVGGGYMYNAVKEVKEVLGQIDGKKPDKSAITRRKFIGNALVGIGGALIVPRAVDRLSIIPLFLGMNVDQKNALQRIYLRLNGLVAHFIPEDHITFFRNLVMADKLLTVAEDFSSKLGKKPRIAFHVGAGHAGMEDFLIAGHDFTRWLIAQYPKGFIQEVIKANASLEDVCGTRILTFPPDFSASPFEKADAYSVFQLKKELAEKVLSEEVLDQPLLEMLRAKFAKEEQAAFNQRRSDIEQLKSLFRKHLSGSVFSKVEGFLNSLVSHQARKYRQMAGIERGTAEGKEYKQYSIVISPKTSDFDIRGLSDIYSRINTKGGQLQYEQISFFLNQDGELSQRHNDLNIVIIPRERLKSTIQSVFPNAPSDDDQWQYTPPGTAATPMAAQGYLRSKVGDEFPKYQYQISSDGEVEVVVWYRP